MNEYKNPNAKQLGFAAETVERHNSDLKFKILLHDGSQIWAKVGQPLGDNGTNISRWAEDEGFYMYLSQFDWVKPSKESLPPIDGIVHFAGQPEDYVMD